MRFEQVKDDNNYTCVCTLCGEHIKLSEAWADLDGPSFKYHCTDCKEKAKHYAVKIILTRAEGLVRECITSTVTGPDCWQSADHCLCSMARTAPGRNNGYHKVNFKIIFDDGANYEGRYDLVHIDLEYPNLANHVSAHLEYMDNDSQMNKTAQFWMNHYQIGARKE